MDSAKQMRTILEIARILEGAGVKAWLFGGWGMDAHVGHVTRDHHDIEFWIERPGAAAARAAIAAAGFRLLDTQPPEEAFEFERDGLISSCALFDRTGDGFAQLEGRWSDWRFPPGSFADAVGLIDGKEARVMSVAGLLAMKEQYPHLKHGKPWRPHDAADVAVLRSLLARGG